jgi:hypothetical protein
MGKLNTPEREGMERAIILALTAEVERLNAEVKELTEEKIRYVWFAGPESGKLSLYTGEKLGRGEILCTVTWSYRHLELEIGYYSGRTTTPECVKFIEDLGVSDVSDASTNIVTLRMGDKTVVCSYSCLGGFKIGHTIGGIKHRYYISAKTGFNIMRAIMKDCERHGRKVPIIMLDGYGQRMPFFPMYGIEKIASIFQRYSWGNNRL